jgi:hypothetical protein
MRRVWRIVRDSAIVLFWALGFALLGAFSSLDSGWPAWWPASVGGAFGAALGLICAGRIKAADNHERKHR